jgi:hypothetical protein
VLASLREKYTLEQALGAFITLGESKWNQKNIPQHWYHSGKTEKYRRSTASIKRTPNII